jgi:hypothetical protein
MCSSYKRFFDDYAKQAAVEETVSKPPFLIPFLHYPFGTLCETFYINRKDFPETMDEGILLFLGLHFQELFSFL